LTAAAAGTASVTAGITDPEVGAVTNGSPVQVVFTGQVPFADTSDLDADPAMVIANGVSASTLTIRVKDADGEGIEDLAEGAFVFAGLGSAVVGGFAEVGDGEYTFALTNTVAEAVSVSVEVSGVGLGSFAAVTFIEPLLVTSSALAAWTVNTAGYAEILAASGGTAPYTWSVTGSLPGGLSLDGATGLISGTPTAVGSFSFTVEVTDQNGFTADAGLDIVINA